jgi:hypothetical protein
LKDVIATLRSPKAIGPYPQAITAGSFLFNSGKLPLGPVSGEIIQPVPTESCPGRALLREKAQAPCGDLHATGDAAHEDYGYPASTRISERLASNDEERLVREV